MHFAALKGVNMDATTREPANQPGGVTSKPSASYITQMLMALKSQAASIDWQLAYILEMAAVHSDEIDSGLVKAVVRREEN